MNLLEFGRPKAIPKDAYTVDQLVKAWGLGERTVERRLHDLKVKGMVEIYRGTTDGHTTRYWRLKDAQSPTK